MSDVRSIFEGAAEDLVDEGGTPAIYNEKGGGQKEIRVIFRNSKTLIEDGSENGTLIRRPVAIVKLVDVSPSEGDLVNIDNVDYIVTNVLGHELGYSHLSLRRKS